MAAIKITSNGKAIQFIDDDGRVFQTSVYDYGLLLNGQKKFITPIRLPHDVSPQRFPPSKLWNPVTRELEVVGRSFKVGVHDAYSLKKSADKLNSDKFVELEEW